jgi:CRISPR-associated endoribonuclease Cas6
MPTLWFVDLAEKPDIRHKSHFVALNAIVCGVFEHPESNHKAGEKPFAVRLATDAGADYGAARLTLCWLDDSATPQIEIPNKLRFGHRQISVVTHGTQTIPYAIVESPRPQRRVRFQMISPTIFRHRDMDWPLPDPYVMFSSLGRRYLALRHGAGPITDETLIRELAGNVAIFEPEIRPSRFSWHDTTTGGFVGSCTYALKRDASPELARAFTTLCAFAHIAGVGHGTTHGLGAATITWPRTK